jgi:hypothetical protein
MRFELSGNSEVCVGFDVLTAVSTKMAVFWVVAPCSLVEVYQHFRGPCCLHHQDFYQTTRRNNSEDSNLSEAYANERDRFGVHWLVLRFCTYKWP